MAKITHLFFDLGGVCLTNGWDHHSREKAAEFFDYDYGESDKRHESVIEKFETGRITRRDYLKETVFYKKRKFTEIDFVGFMESQSKAHKSSFEVLEKLRSQNKYTVSVFNNESLELNLYRIEKFKLKRYFSNFFSSCFLGAKKPDLEIFQKVLGITQIRAEQGILIDDREQNVKAAAGCGFQIVHFPEVAGLEEKLIKKGIIL